MMFLGLAMVIVKQYYRSVTWFNVASGHHRDISPYDIIRSIILHANTRKKTYLFQKLQCKEYTTYKYLIHIKD